MIGFNTGEIRGRSPRWPDQARVRASREGPATNPEEARSRQIERLPAVASSVYGKDTNFYGWNPALRTVLVGTRDNGSALHHLRGLEDQLVHRIFTYVGSQWAEKVMLTIPASCVGATYLSFWDLERMIMRFNTGRADRECFQREFVDYPIGSQAIERSVAFATCGYIDFPEPQGINVNMMPFIMGDRLSLPPNLRPYYDCAIIRCPYVEEDNGKVGYLTVHESMVSAGGNQRRGGLHIESPGKFAEKGSDGATFYPAREHPWGMGMFTETDRFKGGIFMASSVQDTSEVWDALVDNKESGIVDRHGGCEHLRRIIGPGTKLNANELIWMTDCTPHEALPQQTASMRQFFRFVGPYISHWYADHSTPNPVVPLPKDVTIVHGNKFA